MPTYTYRREDGSVFEIEQRITEDALTTCPTTGQPVSRMITGGAGLVFKGSGFYLTDYARKKSSAGADGGSSTGTADGGTSSAKAGADNGSAEKAEKPVKKEAKPAKKE